MNKEKILRLVTQYHKQEFRIWDGEKLTYKNMNSILNNPEKIRDTFFTKRPGGPDGQWFEPNLILDYVGTDHYNNKLFVGDIIEWSLEWNLIWQGYGIVYRDSQTITEYKVFDLKKAKYQDQHGTILEEGFYDRDPFGQWFRTKVIGNIFENMDIIEKMLQGTYI